ncbi:hypothetical protein L484_008689 [Morus notabilis]|uniref:Uncharacterized protein n=1 Tax=Morus notabilis TaxID=981085 RepID=W9R8S5_9ROSA|nr:hypothetical protein L484_008689 [Morus notabilis]
MVRTKRPTNKSLGRVPRNPQISYRTFFSIAAEVQYDQCIYRRSFNPEKGFLLTSAPNMGVFRGEACDDLGGEFCEYEYQKGVY